MALSPDVLLAVCVCVYVCVCVQEVYHHEDVWRFSAAAILLTEMPNIIHQVERYIGHVWLQM